MVDTFNNILKLSFEESVEGPTNWSVLHLFVQLFT